MTAKRIDHTNKKYHHLTLLYPTVSGGAGVGMYWMARCDCGNLKELRASEVKCGYVKTCGNCEFYSTLVKEAAKKASFKNQTRDPKSGERTFLSSYMHSALKRNIFWDLTPEQFSELIKQNCTYCNGAPRTYTKKSRKGKGRPLKITANGIDRIDSKIGYTLSNVVPCCTTCNRMKMALPVSEFLEQCHKISTWLQQSQKLLDDAVGE